MAYIFFKKKDEVEARRVKGTSPPDFTRNIVRLWTIRKRIRTILVVLSAKFDPIIIIR
jgi:hypothetical protein